MLESLFRGTIVWEKDKDFGYEVVCVEAPENQALLDAVPLEILRPDIAFARADKSEIYRDEVALRHEERSAYLESHQVEPNIIAAVVPK